MKVPPATPRLDLDTGCPGGHSRLAAAPDALQVGQPSYPCKHRHLVLHASPAVLHLYMLFFLLMSTLVLQYTFPCVPFLLNASINGTISSRVFSSSLLLFTLSSVVDSPSPAASLNLGVCSHLVLVVSFLNFFPSHTHVSCCSFPLYSLFPLPLPQPLYTHTYTHVSS